MYCKKKKKNKNLVEKALTKYFVGYIGALFLIELKKKKKKETGGYKEYKKNIKRETLNEDEGGKENFENVTREAKIPRVVDTRKISTNKCARKYPRT